MCLCEYGYYERRLWKTREILPMICFNVLPLQGLMGARKEESTFDTDIQSNVHALSQYRDVCSGRPCVFYGSS
jgi:hypothetical protein